MSFSKANHKISKMSIDEIQAIAQSNAPELVKLLDKKLSVKMSDERKVTGILCGFDPFLNLVLDKSVELFQDGKQFYNEGMVVLPSAEITTIEAIQSIQTQVYSY